MAKLFDDKEDIARKNSHQAIEMISETPPGAEGIVNANLVPILVQKLSTEKDEIKVEHSPIYHISTYLLRNMSIVYNIVECLND